MFERIKGYAAAATNWAGHFGNWATIWTILVSAGVFTALGQGWDVIASHGWAVVILFAIAATCVVMLCVSALLAALRYFRPLPLTQTAPAAVASPVGKSQPGPRPDMERHVHQLLNFSVDEATYRMFDYLIRFADDPSVSKAINEGSDADANDAQRFYISAIREMIFGDWLRERFESVMNKAEQEAERQLEETPLDQRPTGDALVLRKHAITRNQFTYALRFLHRERAAVEQRLLSQRRDLQGQLEKHQKGLMKL